jgi:hypothetical protein
VQRRNGELAESMKMQVLTETSIISVPQFSGTIPLVEVNAVKCLSVLTGAVKEEMFFSEALETSPNTSDVLVTVSFFLRKWSFMGKPRW